MRREKYKITKRIMAMVLIIVLSPIVSIVNSMDSIVYAIDAGKEEKETIVKEHWEVSQDTVLDANVEAKVLFVKDNASINLNGNSIHASQVICDGKILMNGGSIICDGNFDIGKNAGIKMTASSE